MLELQGEGDLICVGRGPPSRALAPQTRQAGGGAPGAANLGGWKHGGGPAWEVGASVGGVLVLPRVTYPNDSL